LEKNILKDGINLTKFGLSKPEKTELYVKSYFCFDNAILEANYFLFKNPNDPGPLIKFVEHCVGSNCANWPKDQIGLQLAQKRVPTGPL
jgi:hypothetical protein